MVEDNDLNREIAREILGEVGLLVEEAEDGSIALDMLLEKGPGYYDLVLMDIQMPVMNGYEATRAIRALDRPDAGTIPIIAMTANLFDEDVAACLGAGMDAHIPKPLEAGQMIRTIAEWLERKKQ